MIYKNAKIWVCKYCDGEFFGRKTLYEHYKICSERKKLPKDSKGRIIGQFDRSAAAKKGVAVAKANGTFVTHKLSEETKKKISEGRKRCLKEGRGNHWINPSIKRSYAEEYFFDIFKDTKCESNLWVGHYCLDFAWPSKKIYIEVDGEQHYTPEGIQHDEERTDFLLEKGWKLLKRIRWSEFKKLSYNEKHAIIVELLSDIAATGETGLTQNQLH